MNPVTPATNFFISFLNIIPSPIKLLMLVACGFAVIATIVRFVLK